jgi:hypothetical protein
MFALILLLAISIPPTDMVWTSLQVMCEMRGVSPGRVTECGVFGAVRVLILGDLVIQFKEAKK